PKVNKSFFFFFLHFHRLTELQCCFLTEYSPCNITQYGNNEDDAAHNVCAAPEMEKAKFKLFVATYTHSKSQK
ncbi:hypothetical protein DVA81_18375, partial [Acinetobacter baumannii]